MNLAFFIIPGLAGLLFIVADIVMSERRRRRAVKNFFAANTPQQFQGNSVDPDR